MVKQEADKRVGRSWYHNMHIHAALCATCAHPKWRHMGIGEPACTYLGSCPCRAFTRHKETA